MRTGNPALKDDTFSKVSVYAEQSRMTLMGTVNKSFILLLLVILSATWSWSYLPTISTSASSVILTGSIVLGFIVSLICVFKPRQAFILGPMYAVLEGVFLGNISRLYNVAFDGIVVQAVLLTLSIFFVLLMLYRLKLIQATKNFRLMVVSATIGIGIVYFITFILSLFGVYIPYIHSNGTVGLIISIFVVTMAALNLVLDFDFIERGVEHGSPKYMEWYGAFGLVVTLVWLYLEVLRLLAKMRSRD